VPLLLHSLVYARDIVFQPHGQQSEYFSEEAGPVTAVNPKILIAKLRPGQIINLQMHCQKGIGADHAKFSPVATASYRLLPHIQILKPIIGRDARKFARCFPKGVIDLVPVTTREAAEEGSEYYGCAGEVKAVVANPMLDTVSRECLRHPEFRGKVKLGRVQDHFIYRVESSGQIESAEIFLESVRLLRIKCERVKRMLESSYMR